MSHFSKNRYSITVLPVLECHRLPAALAWQAGRCHTSRPAWRGGTIPHAVSAGSVCAHPLQGPSVTLSSSGCFSCVCLAFAAARPSSYGTSSVVSGPMWPLGVSEGERRETMPERAQLICILCFCYKREHLFLLLFVGRAVIVQKLIEEDEVNAYCLGFALLSHVVSWSSSTMTCDRSVPWFWCLCSTTHYLKR